MMKDSFLERPSYFTAAVWVWNGHVELALTHVLMFATCIWAFPAQGLKAFDEVVPAAGSTSSALRISPDRLAALTDAKWVDVCSALQG